MKWISHIFKSLWGRITGRKAKILEKIRTAWANPGTGTRDFDLITLYHKFKTASEPMHTIDDKTWQDLDMDSIFTDIDTSTSFIGSQYLYHQMRTYNQDKASLDRNFKQYDLLRKDKNLRESIQLILYKLKDKNAAYLPYIFYEAMPTKPRFYILFYLSSALALFSTIMIFFFSPFLFIAIVFFIMNLIIHYLYESKVNEFSSAFSHLGLMLNTAVLLSSIKSSQPIAQIQDIAKYKKLLEQIRKVIGWMVIDKSQLTELAAMTIEYLNHFCLFDIHAFYRSIEKLKKHITTLQTIYEDIASLDASIATASYIQRLKYFSQINFTSEKKIDLTYAYHPLLEEPVPNSLRLDNISALITGSNMTGKTTFIKTIGVNVIFAQTLSFCLAERAVIPFLEVKSLIDREDDLEQAKSYFFVEVEQIMDFINLGKKENKYLFLLDEIYRGTNTAERIAASASVLKYIGKNNLIAATTHDIELQELLKEFFQMFHFSEKVSDNTLYFDYKITPGPCTSRNAIKLLELTGYPETITTEALRLVNMGHK